MTEQEVKRIANEICYDGRCVAGAVDSNDIKWLFANKKRVDGFVAECPYYSYGKEIVEGINGLTTEGNCKLTEMIIYIDTAEKDNITKNMKRIRHIADRIGLYKLSQKVHVTFGVGTSKNVPLGSFCLKVMAGYE